MGGGFGSKTPLAGEPVAALLAMKTGRPVRVAFTREEMFTCGGTRTPPVIYIKDGVRKDGILVAREIKLLLGLGAYAIHGPIIARHGPLAAAALYHVSNLKADAYAVYTNEPIVAPFRGFGTEGVVWAIESQMDMIAEKLGIDAVEMRKKNLLREGDVNATGEIVHSIGAGKCLEQVAESVVWGKKPEDKEALEKGERVGFGHQVLHCSYRRCCYCQGTGRRHH